VTIYRDGSRNEQVLHITGNDREKRFQVKPSIYLHDYILANIHEPYVLDQVNPIFKNYGSSDQYVVATNTIDNKLESNSFESDTVSINTKPDPYALTRTENDKESCPVCKNYLIITEGCNMCIECGFSSCGSG
jgi:ribonucleoside-diphosphate reductase alpha chain